MTYTRESLTWYDWHQSGSTQCSGVSLNGTRCRNPVSKTGPYCFRHGENRQQRINRVVAAARKVALVPSPPEALAELRDALSWLPTVVSDTQE